MIVEKIKISNFKRVSECTVELSDITYLVGGNNSGKSSVLQAIHMAISCAQRSSELGQQVIADSSLRYCPTGDFQNLGNSAAYENRKDGSRGIVELFGKTNDNADASCKITIYKARNFNNVGVERSGVWPGFGQQISDPASLFSVYVPGLAGIPHNEEMKSYASVFLKAAGGDANLVFRNIIRLISERGKLEELESLLFDIVGPYKFRVTFDGSRDLYVDVKISFEDGAPEESFVPIDLSGTGVMQVTQILAYAILFKPTLLLVDEPDSHLHPSRQALLATAFEKLSSAYECKVIVSTHSRHLISSASEKAKLVWLRNGTVETQENSGLVAVLLDLGALDQLDSAGADILICTEDRGKKQLEACVRRVGVGHKIKVISYNGVNNAAAAAIIRSASDLFPQKPRVIIHRDRDFLLDDEISKWAEDYVNRGISVFCPKLPDIESYYVTANHIAATYDISVDEATKELDIIYGNLADDMRKKFRDKRREANSKFWKDGGAPITEQLWSSSEPVTKDRLLGKDAVCAVNRHFAAKPGGRKNIFGAESDELCVELLGFITRG